MTLDPASSWLQYLDTVTRSAVGSVQSSRPKVPGLTLLSHAAADRIGERAPWLDHQSGRPLEISRLEPQFAPPSRGQRRPLGDPYLSRRPVILRPDHGGGYVVDRSRTRVPLAVDGQEVPSTFRIAAEALDHGVVLTLSDRVALLLHRFDPIREPDLPEGGLIGESEGIVEVRRHIQRVADLDLSVLLRGETGTGKELVAQAIHQASPRSEEPFLAVNLGAVPPSLAASELFGATKGAFTGADRQRQGFFRRAESGTLLLDEIGEAPVEIQVLLLRALETGKVSPVGSSREFPYAARILAATDAPLEQAIADERLRAPFLHRLRGYEIRLPPLRERREDIPRLMLGFLRQELEASGLDLRRLSPVDAPRPWLPADLVTRWVLYSWPGNVRQLRNLTRQLLVGNRGASGLRITPEIDEILRDDPAHVPAGEKIPNDGGTPDAGQIALDDASTAEAPSDLATPEATTPVGDQITDDATGESPAPPAAREAYRSPREVGEEELLAALRAHQFRILPTARALGVSRASLYNLIDQCSAVRKAADLSATEIEASSQRHDGDLDGMAADLEVSRKGLSRRMTELDLH